MQLPRLSAIMDYGLNVLRVMIAITFLSLNLYYFITGYGGDMLHTVTVVPLAISILALNDAITSKSKVLKAVNIILALMGLFIALYLRLNFYNLLLYRLFYSYLDMLIALIIFLVVIWFTWRSYRIIALLIAILAIYSVYGYLFPEPFWHPGIPWFRVLTGLTIEFEVGVFGPLAKLGAVLIAAVFLITVLAFAFRVPESIIKTFLYIAGGRVQVAPFVAVGTSSLTAMATGSGAANTAMVGQFTIPLMIKAGLKPHFAAAIEASAGMGALITPPIMGIAAFLIAESMGVHYWEVALRGFFIAFIYYAVLAYSVWLLTSRFVRSPKIGESGGGHIQGSSYTRPDLVDIARVLVFIGLILYLVYTLGFLWWDVTRAAYTGAILFLGIYTIIELVFVKSPIKGRVIHILRRYYDFILLYARETSNILMLLASLGMVVGVFTITGWILKLFGVLVGLGRENILALFLIAYLTGLILGMGLPPTGVYVILSVLILPIFVQLGVEAWIVHFFAFYIATLGEVTPPVAPAAVIAAQIARESFIKVGLVAARILLVLFIMPFIILQRNSFLLNPSLDTIVLYDITMILVASLAIATAFFSSISNVSILDKVLKSLLILLGLLLALNIVDNHYVNLGIAILLIPFIFYGAYRSLKGL